MKKIVSFLLMFIMLLSGSIVCYGASAASDYTTFKYGNVEDAGSNTVRIYGKGVMGTTTKQGSSFASAALYKNAVDAKNISFDLEFVKDYGNGEGRQAGWYAFSISKTPNWFSSVKSVIKAEEISGINVIFKLDTVNKKKVYLEVARYSPGSGFTHVFGSTIEANIKADWKCHVDITNGVLYVDGAEILDLSDAIAISLGGTGKGYLGFGGFSENSYDIEIKVTFEGTKAEASSTTTTPNSSAGNNQNTKPEDSKNPTQNTDKDSETANSDNNSENVNTENPDTENVDTENNDTEATESEDVSTEKEDTANVEVNGDEPKDNENSHGLLQNPVVLVLIAVLAIALLGCGMIGVLLIKKMKRK